MQFTTRHGQEVGEIKALAHALGQRVEAAQRELESILSIQRRQLAAPDRSGSTQADTHREGSLIAFVHIPKTAGGTVTNMLAAAYSRAAVHEAGNYIRGPEKAERKITKRPGGWERWQRGGGRVIVGHVPYALFRQRVPSDTRYMTFLREPVDRVLSHYYRHMHAPELSRADRIKRTESGRITAASLEEALVEMRVPRLSNLCTRFLCGHHSPMRELPPSALDDAKANLREFAFVGLQERFDESLVLLQRRLGLGLLPYLNRHVSIEGRRPGVDEIPHEERALIEEYNRLDVELYRFGQQLFEDGCASADKGFTADVERLRALSVRVNQEAIQSACDLLDRELPAGSTRRSSALSSAAQAAAVPAAALKRASALLSVKRWSDEDGNQFWTRPKEAPEYRPRAGV
jgi:hypothetical protein